MDQLALSPSPHQITFRSNPHYLLLPVHTQIAQRALEALVELINSLGQDFNAYTSSVLQHVVDR